jgi:glycosyltransferase involved in cell wall biosynthesis
MPVPSAIPVDANAGAAADVRARYAGGRPLVGHFGTFGPLIGPLLLDALPAVAGATGARVLLMGRGSEAAAATAVGRWPALRERISGTGTLEPRAVSHHLAACDVMLQPYPDGVSSRRTSVMAALAHGRPVVTTIGELSERIWQQGAGVIGCPVGDVEALARGCATVVSTPSERARLSAEARTIYDGRFDLRHTIAMLRAPAGPAGLRAAS